ncbi:MAG: hypothetical protein KBC96_00375 [Armatimonadetes bacterium]|nr:hypothetical protein [Armatimonadota bacterium]
MIPAVVRRFARAHAAALAIGLLFAAAFLVFSGDPAHGADERAALRPYSPFEEPVPNLPSEALGDRRLDRRIRVASATLPLGDLLARISDAVGVRLDVEPKIGVETPAVFFRSRPIRDVMSELSRVYGYSWRAVPHSGGPRYEFMESADRARTRSVRLRDDKRRADEMLLDFLRKYLSSSPEDERIKNLAWTNSAAYQSLFGPNSAAARNLLSALGEERLAGAFGGGPPAAVAFSNLPADAQTAACEWVNAMRQGGMRWRSESSPAPPAPVDPSGMMSSTLYVSGNEVSDIGVSRLTISVAPPNGDPVTMQWPSRQMRYDDLAAVAGWVHESAVPPSVHSELSISPRIPATRLWLNAGDIIEAIAEQSGMDVIADAVERDRQYPLVSGVPLGKLVEQLSRDEDYAVQADESTLRFRLARWYARPMITPPPADLVERCWRDIERDGRIGLANLLELSRLPSDQAAWPGFRNMPGASAAFQQPTAALRLWAALKETPMPEGGFRVSDLNSGAAGDYQQWIDSLPRDTVTPEQASSASIVIAMRQGAGPFGQGRGGGSAEYPEISISAGGTRLVSHPVRLSQGLNDDDRLALMEARRAEREAVVVKLMR